jgi:hyperosmotically inducible periplasmic protein
MLPRKGLLLVVLLSLGWVSSALAQGGRYDVQIQDDVQKTLQSNPKFQDVQAAVEDGVVMLTGTAKLYFDKLEAEKKIRHIKHIEGVRNHIEVETSVPDDVLLEKLANKLRYDRIGYGIMFNSLKLGVQDGVVTVSGEVRDYPAKDSALAIIATEPGVKDVIDDIKVLPVSNFDDELRIKVARAIYRHPALQKYAIDPQAPIRIVVNNGHVTLDGVVDSAMDKQIAGMQASGVPGVFSVENNLMVANEKGK